MLISTVLALAIVTQNQTPMRASPREASPQQALLWQGDALEIRGQTMDYLQVYDHRRERAGYIKISQARAISLDPNSAPELLSVVRFLRDTPGAEALGVSYAAAYLKSVPAAALTAEPFDALGEMADRLAHRASTNQIKANESALTAHLEVVAQYGVVMNSFDVGGVVRVCYDGDMFRHVLQMPSADNAQRARAALGLTRHECVDPNIGPTGRYKWDQWRADILDSVTLNGLTQEQRGHLRLRRAGVWAALAYQQSRRGESPQSAAVRALQELASVNKSELSDDDRLEYTDAAIRVGASRWAAQAARKPAGNLTVVTQPGAVGETCVLLQDARHDTQDPLLKRCTYAMVWVASASSNPAGTMLTLAVQPFDTWREMWVFRKTYGGWTCDVIPPGESTADSGYVEFAGWIPGTDRILTAREINTDGHFSRRFEIMNLESLAVEHHATTPEYLTAFLRWQDPSWKQQTVAVR